MSEMNVRTSARVASLKRIYIETRIGADVTLRFNSDGEVMVNMRASWWRHWRVALTSQHRNPRQNLSREVFPRSPKYRIESQSFLWKTLCHQEVLKLRRSCPISAAPPFVCKGKSRRAKYNQTLAQRLRPAYAQALSFSPSTTRRQSRLPLPCRPQWRLPTSLR